MILSNSCSFLTPDTEAAAAGAAEGSRKVNREQAQITQAATKCFGGEDDHCLSVLPRLSLPCSGVEYFSRPESMGSPK